MTTTACGLPFLRRIALVALALLAATSACTDDARSGDPDAEVQDDVPLGDVADVGDDQGDVTDEPTWPRASVTVIRDDLGSPHIFADSREDAYWAQGYEMADDRMFHMEYMRRRAYGELAELFGAEFVESDRLSRVLGLREIAQANAAHYRDHFPDVYALIDAYARGVNAWRDDLVAGVVPRSASLDRIEPGFVPAPWTPQDSIAVAKLIVLSFSFQPDLELAIFAGELLMTPSSWRELHPFTPLFATNALEVAPTPESELALPGANNKRIERRFPDLEPADRDRVVQALVPLVQLLTHASGRAEVGIPGGSNAWTVGGAFTESGAAILCNDTHMDLQLPSVLYPAHLVEAGRDDVGAVGWILPGAPGMLIGNTADTAWGITNAFADVADLYIERLTEDGGSVMLGTRTVPLEISEHIILVRREGAALGDVDELPLTVRRVPHHGPIFNDLLPEEVGRTLSQFGFVFSVSWPGFATDTEEFVTFDQLLDARTIDDQVAALSHFTSGAMNWHLADVQGDHGYIPGGAYPDRPWDLDEAPPWAPLPSDGDHEWNGLRPHDETPRLLRPAKGYTASANNAMNDGALDGVPENAAFYMHHFVDLGTRAWRITNELEALVERGDVTLDDMRALQIDTHAVFADVFVPTLAAARDRVCAGDDARACAATDRLVAWDRSQPGDSAEAALFNVWLLDFAYLYYRDDTPDLIWDLVGNELDNTALRSLGHLVLGRTPPSGSDYVDLEDTDEVETVEDLAIIALGVALDRLDVVFDGAPMDTWRWDTLHTTTWEHLTWPDLNVGPVPSGGSLRSINAGDFSLVVDGELAAPPYRQNEGAQIRHCVELLPEGPVVWGSLNGGVSDDFESPHAADQIEEWLAGVTRLRPWDRAALDAGATSTRVHEPR